MKSVGIEEAEQVQADTFKEFIKLFPVLMNKPKVDNIESIKSYYLAKQEMEIHMVRILSHYRLFVDRLNKANDFEAFSEELFMRQLDHYKAKLAESQSKDDDKPAFTVVDNGDFNEQN